MKFEVGGDEAGERVDRWVARKLACSGAEAKRLVAEGRVRVDGKRVKKGQLLKAGSAVEIEASGDKRPQPQPELPLVTLLVDEALVAMVKPIGMPTHPLRPGETGTLANALVARFPECANASEDPREGGMAHRLDRDTSGVIVAARTVEDWRALRRSFSAGRVHKEYLALVTGDPPPKGVVEMPLRQVGKLVKPIPDGELDARTEFERLAHAPTPSDDRALLRVTAETGRMHQVRAHLAFIGHPLVGDALYGGPPQPGGHFLHAWRLRFPHPRDGRETVIKAALPAERAKILKELFNWSED
jgi:23S rRNA pseudouridine1911/1915/1917 synthase